MHCQRGRTRTKHVTNSSTKTTKPRPREHTQLILPTLHDVATLPSISPGSFLPYFVKRTRRCRQVCDEKWKRRVLLKWLPCDVSICEAAAAADGHSSPLMASIRGGTMHAMLLADMVRNFDASFNWSRDWNGCASLHRISRKILRLSVCHTLHKLRGTQSQELSFPTLKGFYHLYTVFHWCALKKAYQNKKNNLS